MIVARNNTANSALIIIDMTNPIPEQWLQHQDAHCRLIVKINNLISRWNGPVILANYGVGDNKSIHTHIASVETEVLGKKRHLISYDKETVINYLNSNNITNVHYVGQSMPGCIMFRPLGYKALTEEGFNCTVLPKYTEFVCGKELNIEDTIHEAYHFMINNNINIEYM